jgi:hypothetical protein
VVPHDLQTYFSVGVALSGTLIGLLFVSITLRYDAIFIQGFRYRARATAAFVSLVDAMVLCMWALIPSVNLGYPAAITGAAGLVVTFRTHIGPSGRRDTSTGLFVASLTGQTGQIVLGALLVSAPRDRTFVDWLTYVVFYAVVVGLVRAWQLLLPEKVGPAPAAPEEQPEIANTAPGAGVA